MGQEENKKGANGATGQGDESGGTSANGKAGSAGGSGHATRLGLLIPTLILAAYVGYVISKWQDLTQGGGI